MASCGSPFLLVPLSASVQLLITFLVLLLLVSKWTVQKKREMKISKAITSAGFWFWRQTRAPGNSLNPWFLGLGENLWWPVSYKMKKSFISQWGYWCVSSWAVGMKVGGSGLSLASPPGVTTGTLTLLVVSRCAHDQDWYLSLGGGEDGTSRCQHSGWRPSGSKRNRFFQFNDSFQFNDRSIRSCDSIYAYMSQRIEGRYFNRYLCSHVRSSFIHNGW